MQLVSDPENGESEKQGRDDLETMRRFAPQFVRESVRQRWNGTWYKVERALQYRRAFGFERWPFGTQIRFVLWSLFLIVARGLRTALLAQTPAHAGTVQNNYQHKQGSEEFHPPIVAFLFPDLFGM